MIPKIQAAFIKNVALILKWVDDSETIAVIIKPRGVKFKQLADITSQIEMAIIDHFCAKSVEIVSPDRVTMVYDTHSDTNPLYFSAVVTDEDDEFWARKFKIELVTTY